MHRHLYLVVARPKVEVERESLRPAKVISLEARRKARFEEKRSVSQPKRPAA